MNERVLQFLRCPKCLGVLHPVVYERGQTNQEIFAGLLACRCEARYPIWKGVPRMLMPRNRTLPVGYLECP